MTGCSARSLNLYWIIV